MNKKFSASMACSSFVELRESIQNLNNSVDFFHIDIMDDHFVQNLGLSYDQIIEIRKFAKLPFDFHLMTDNPYKTIAKNVVLPGDMVSIHIESVFDFADVVKEIKKIDAKVLLAISPFSPIKCIELVFDLIDGINYLTVIPGYASQMQVGIAEKQAESIGNIIGTLNKEDFIFEVDGNMSFENIKIFSGYGANHFVLGTSSIFPNYSLDKKKLDELDSIR
ncbi:hypothetical protein ELQ12_06610 [Campylobacter sp. US25a]|uniref:ribulose-phosphate 3-epimerase n=1 Tax=Campylobacter sp. US25a TaxID=2498119 RepID=UPI00106892B2|nr:hypothetical protein [Campylobacter sp. US25a]TEY07368.1 hypothetical protein ELQ12_06610 [Campylobacter sp. US25a]